MNTGAPKWIGYQILYGAGIGLGLNQSLIAVQAALPPFQIAEGTAVIIFMQTFGGTIVIAVAQNVFNNKLISNVLAAGIPVNPAALLFVGATRLQTLVEPQYFDRLQSAYNESITQVSFSATVKPPRLTRTDFLRRRCHSRPQHHWQCANSLVQCQKGPANGDADWRCREVAGSSGQRAFRRRQDPLESQECSSC